MLSVSTSAKYGRNTCLLMFRFNNQVQCIRALLTISAVNSTTVAVAVIIITVIVFSVGFRDYYKAISFVLATTDTGTAILYITVC